MPLNAIQILVWHKTFGPTQNILGPVAGQGMDSVLLRCYRFGTKLIKLHLDHTPQLNELLQEGIYLPMKF